MQIKVQVDIIYSQSKKQCTVTFLDTRVLLTTDLIDLRKKVIQVINANGILYKTIKVKGIIEHDVQPPYSCNMKQEYTLSQNSNPSIVNSKESAISFIDNQISQIIQEINKSLLYKFMNTPLHSMPGA